MTIPFVNLHAHTCYSRPFGVMRIDHMVERTRELEQTATAITDSGVLGGVFEFQKAAQSSGIKPIIGMEVHIAHDDGENNQRSDPFGNYHLTLLARNAVGYRNLCRLSTKGFMSQRQGRPSVGRSDLERWSDGIIALSGCTRGEIARLLLSGEKEQAAMAANRYRETYGLNNFYLEIVPGTAGHGARFVQAIRELSDACGIPVVATADAHYAYPGQEATENLVRRIHGSPECARAGRYLRSAEEMLAALPGCEGALANTVCIAERCSFELPASTGFFPQTIKPNGESATEHLSRLCAEGLEKRYGSPTPSHALACFQREFANIEKKRLAEYFLALKAMIDLVRRKGISAGSGDSAITGSIVAYLLGITSIDPLAHGFFSECFLNNELIPEMKLSVERGGRQVVLDTIDEVFHNCLHAEIAAYGRYTIRSGLADAGYALDMPPEQIDPLIAMIPDAFILRKKDVALQDALETIPSLREKYATNQSAKYLLDAAGSLEGILRGPRTTPLYAMIADRSVANVMPLMLCDGVTTQYDLHTLREMGINRVSIFESDALAVVKRTVEAIRESRNVELDVQCISPDDQDAYTMLSRGESGSVVHLESSGFRRFLTRLRPESFSDLTAMIALYRPASMHALNDFVAAKDEWPPLYPYPAMESIFGETYGMLVYYEQIIALAVTLADFSPENGERMCRAMVRGDADRVEAYREKFIRQALYGITAGDANQIYTYAADSVRHCSSKAHSVCAARLAYQCAYLKCHYPEEYLSATRNGSETRTSSFIPPTVPS